MGLEVVLLKVVGLEIVGLIKLWVGGCGANKVVGLEVVGLIKL